MVQFLWQRGFVTSARSWYAKGISKALLFARKQEALVIFRSYFPGAIRKHLLKGLKNRIKWACLYAPWVYSAVQRVKQALKRGKHESRNLH